MIKPMKSGVLVRIIKFSIVGGSGVIVNQGFLFILHSLLQCPLWVSSLIAIEFSILTNFVLNDIWTWRDRHARKLWGRIWRYHLSVGITAYGINYSVLLFLAHFAGIPYIWANFAGIFLAALANFIINHFWTYSEKRLFFV